MSTETLAEVYVDVVINAAHQLPHVHPKHRCRNMHGHDFRIRIVVQGRVNRDCDEARIVQPGEVGMVIDYDRVLEAWGPLFEKLDHRVLNDVEGLENPTCENLAVWILRRTPSWVCRVEVSTTMQGGAGGAVVRRVDLGAVS